MELLEQYLKTVRANLPKSQQDDIIRELSENIRAQMEDREASLGRPLTQAEQEAILKAHGHPMAVASRYRGEQRSFAFGRQWIGPELFPIYSKILLINAVVTAAVFVAAIVASAAGLPVGPIVPSAALTILLQFGIITGLFIAFQSKLNKDPDRWDPITGAPPTGLEEAKATGLDAVAVHVIGKRYARVPRLLSIFELALGVACLLWWLGVSRFAHAVFNPASIGFMRPGPGWNALYVSLLVLIAASLLQPLVNLVRPDWARYRSFARTAFGGLVALALLLSLRGSWVVASSSNIGSREIALVRAINQWIPGICALIVGLVAITVALELRRAVRWGREESPHTGQATNGNSVVATL